MPLPKYDGSPEKEWISKCMADMPAGEYSQEQALAICYKQMEMSAEEMAIEDTSELFESSEKGSKIYPSGFREGKKSTQTMATVERASIRSDHQGP